MNIDVFLKQFVEGYWGALKLSPVSKLGLLYFHPERTKQDSIEQLLYEADIQWIEIERNNKKFLNFLDGVCLFLNLLCHQSPHQIASGVTILKSWENIQKY